MLFMPRECKCSNPHIKWIRGCMFNEIIYSKLFKIANKDFSN